MRTTPEQFERMREARKAEEEAKRKLYGTPRWQLDPKKKKLYKKLFGY